MPPPPLLHVAFVGGAAALLTVLSTPAEASGATVYLIEKLWTDNLENNLSDARGYDVIGYTPDKAEAEAIVAAGGLVEGTGWPIDKGETEPRLRMREITRIKAP